MTHRIFGVNDAADEPGPGQGTQVLSRPKPELKAPQMYHVVLLNDDFTPMDFVVKVLKTQFHKSQAEAEKIMLAVHHEGAGVAGTYSFEIAETKAVAVVQLAKQHEHPLKAIVKEAD